MTPAAGYVTPTGALVARGLGVPVLLRGDSDQGQAGLRRLARRLRGHTASAPWSACWLSACWRRRASPAAAGGLFNGNANLLFAQAIAVVAVGVYTVVVTLAAPVLLDRLLGLRVSAEEEDLGLDLTQHGQRGYMMGEGELIGSRPQVTIADRCRLSWPTMGGIIIPIVLQDRGQRFPDGFRHRQLGQRH